MSQAVARSGGWSTGTPVFLAAAVAGGVAVAGAVEAVAHSPKLALGAIAVLALTLLSIRRLDFALFVLVALTYAQGFVVIKDHAGVPSAAFPFAVLIAVVAFFARERGEPFLPQSAEPAVAAFAAYGAWLIASAAWATDAGLTLPAAGAYWKLMLMVVAVLALVRTPRLLRLAIWAVVLAAAVLAAMTILQHFSKGLTFFGFAQPPVNELTSTGQVTRALGPIGNPNAYAQMLVVAIPLAFGRLLGERRLALRLLAATTMLFCAAAIYLTFSRGGFVGLAVVLALCGFRYRPKLALLAVAAAALLLVAGSLSGSYSSRLGTLTQALPWRSDAKSHDPSIQGRAAFLHAGLHLWREHPFGGVGYANFSVSYQAYNRGVGADPTLGSTAHDLPLEIVAETGVVGLALWVALVLAAFTSLRGARSRAGDEDRRDARFTVDSLAISLVGYLATSLFLGGAYALLGWLLLALCFAARGALGSDVYDVKRAQPAR